jgi:hypothetical protein
VKCYNTSPLDDDVVKHYPNSILLTKLHQLKIDWLLHGKKAICTNFLNSLYLSFNSTKQDLGNQWLPRHGSFLQLFRLHIRSNFTEQAKGSFKLTGVEAKSFFRFFRDLIPTLCHKPETIQLMEEINDLFALLELPRCQKKMGSYISQLKTKACTISLNWAIRFGEETMKGKKYLHGIIHLWQVEKYFLENNLPTIESYTMQGREGRNKTIGSYKAKHFPAITKQKVGKKKEGQREREAEKAHEEQELAAEVEVKWQYEATRLTIAQILAALPSFSGSSKLKKGELIAVGKQLLVKQALHNYRRKQDELEHMQRTAAFHIISRNYRDLKSSSKNYHNIESSNY